MAAVMSEADECASDEVPRDVIEVAAVLDVLPVELSEVVNESVDVVPWRVSAWFSVPIWLLADQSGLYVSFSMVAALWSA
jgi:hypothetical protein